MRILGQWMERNRAVSLLLCALLLAAGPVLARERKVLQRSATDPQTRAADAWLDQGSALMNHGGDQTLQVQSRNNNRNQRALVQFDLSSVPSSGIKVATLSLWMSTAPTGTSRTYQARRVTSLWTESSASWTNRALCSTCTPAWTAAWTAAGGDNSGAATSSTAMGTASGVFRTWDIAADVRQWYGGAAPSANYGTLIMDSAESSGATARTAIFSSNEENVTPAHRPSLTLEFIQNVQGLATTAGDSQITLSWTYPPQVPGSTVVSATNGVLILRVAGAGIPSTTAPTDGTVYTRNAGCTNNIAAATIIFSSSTLPTSFNDSAAGDNPNCPPANGTTYYYKVFVKDAANNYSHNQGATNPSIYIPMTLGTPSATASLRQSAAWLASTGIATLSTPGVIPSNVVIIGAPSNIVSGIKPSDGTPMFGWVSVAGAINGRPPVLDASISSTGMNVAYVADADASLYGFVYGINAFTGDILWMTNPTGLATNNFLAGPGVVVKQSSDALGGGYSRMTDLVVVGTRSASTSTNQVVGIDGNTGATVWTFTGGGTNPAMDIVSSTPYVDYVNHAIWVTSRSNNGTGQPSLWKININTTGPLATALATANLGNISDSPIVTFTGDVLFVGNDAGTLYAINPTNAATLSSYAATSVIGSPILMTNSSPYTVVFTGGTGGTTLTAITFDRSTNTFAATGAGTWSTTMPGGCTPSAPIGFPGLAKIYVGCSDGNLYQFDAATGTNDGVRFLRGGGFGIGDPTLDVELSRVIAGCTNSRVFAFTFPF